MSSGINPNATPSVRLFRVIVTLGTHLQSLMDRRLAAIGLTTQQAAVLTIVDLADHPPSLGLISTRLGTTHQNVRQIVTALERKGLVTITIDPDDRRVRRVSITPKVSDLFSDRDRDDRTAVAQWLAVLDEEDKDTAASLLESVLFDLVGATADTS